MRRLMSVLITLLIVLGMLHAPQSALAAPEKLGRTNVHLEIAIIGNDKNGAAQLAAAITKEQAKKGLAKLTSVDEILKAPTELIGGIKIAASHVEFESQTRHYTLTYCPTHTDVKNLFTSPARIDGLIWFVNASDGSMPIDRDEVKLSSKADLPGYLVVFMDDTDIDDELVELVDLEIREMIDSFDQSDRSSYQSTKGEDTPIIHGSVLKALQGDDRSLIKDLLEVIDTTIPEPYLW